MATSTEWIAHHKAPLKANSKNPERRWTYCGRPWRADYERGTQSRNCRICVKAARSRRPGPETITSKDEKPDRAEARELQRRHLIWLIERYGHARRQGPHQGRMSAEWLASIKQAICVFERRTLLAALRGDQIYRHLAALSYLDAHDDPFIRPEDDTS